MFKSWPLQSWALVQNGQHKWTSRLPGFWLMVWRDGWRVQHWDAIVTNYIKPFHKPPLLTVFLIFVCLFWKWNDISNALMQNQGSLMISCLLSLVSIQVAFNEAMVFSCVLQCWVKIDVKTRGRARWWFQASRTAASTFFQICLKEDSRKHIFFSILEKPFWIRVSF